MKKINVLGSTGSIGTQTLEVITELNKWQVQALSAYKNIDLLEEQIKRHQPQIAVVVDEDAAYELDQRIKGSKTEVLTGVKGLNEIAGQKNIDLVLNAIVGAAGLAPSIAALKAGNKLALANKETLVSGGPLVKKIASEKNVQILPVDSEHNAIFQLLTGHKEELSEIILTASGGPFFNHTLSELESVSVAEALKHPNWEMGSKITIDSATFMNKGLEVIEAHWLFNVDYDNIKVAVHPQSIIHSMIRLNDGSLLAELGPANMKLPIQFCLTYPERKSSSVKHLDLFSFNALEFKRPDHSKFPALKLAYAAGRAGGTLPAVLNAANEVAVANFLKGIVPFMAISSIVAQVMEKHNNTLDPDLGTIFTADKWARQQAEEVINKWY